jgi:ABC-2 type transport system permease protein
LIAVMPSTLTQSQMPNFVNYIKAGGPTLIFDDPLPLALQPPGPPALAPRLNLQPSSPFGGEPRADGGTALSLLSALNLSWDNGEVAWDLYNPFPEYEDQWVQGLYTVVGDRETALDAVNDQSPVTLGLGRMLLLYSGTIRENTPDKMEFTPLLKSGEDLSGVFSWEEIVHTPPHVYQGQDPFTRQPTRVEYIEILPVEDTLPPIDMEGLSDAEKQRALRNTRFRPDGKSHVFAAQIRGKAENKVNAIYVADADMISDVFFEIRRERSMNLDLDNVSFVLNAIDVLAGEDAFLELRRRKPPQPSLSEIEKEKEGLRAIQRAAVNKSRAGIIEKQAELQKIIEDLNNEINRTEDQSFAESLRKAIDARMTLNAEKQRLDKEQKKLTDQLNQKIEEAKANYERGVKLKENEIRLKAIVLPAIPAIAMGLIFLSVRLINERREIAPDRRR